MPVTIDDDDDRGHGSDIGKVGYGKPPRHTQFKPGQSGNPRGRPRGARGVRTDLAAELSATWTTSINGRQIKGTKQRLMFRTLTARAATGDVKAAAILLPLILQVLGIEDRGGERQRLSPQDQALLDELLGNGATKDAPPEPTANDGCRAIKGRDRKPPASDQQGEPDGEAGDA